MCRISNPLNCPTDIVHDAVSSIGSSAFSSIVESFVSSANSLLLSFAKQFVAIPPVDLTSPGISGVYKICLGLAGVVAALLLFGQVIRTALTHDGSALAQGLIGVGKAALAFMLTVTITATALRAADELTNFIVVQSFGSTKALSDRLGKVVAWSTLDPGSELAQSSALVLLLAVVGMLLTLVLWFELLLRNAAIAVLVATSPIAAAGQVSESTKSWWSKTATATAQLIILKPVIALVFALGFGMTGKSDDLTTLLAGILVLILAVFAWPVIARFFTFASVAVGGAAGLGAVLGFAAGRASGGGGGGSPIGVDPAQFSQASEARTMSAIGTNAEAAGAGGKAVGASGATAGAGALAGPAALLIAGVQAGQQAINSMAGRMEQMAGHAGVDGARPYGYAAGAPQSYGTSTRGGGTASAPPPPERSAPLDDGEAEQAPPEASDPFPPVGETDPSDHHDERDG